MLIYRDGIYRKLGADIQKSIKLDFESYEIINGMPGRSFSDKVRNTAYEYRRLKEQLQKEESITKNQDLTGTSAPA